MIAVGMACIHDRPRQCLAFRHARQNALLGIIAGDKVAGGMMKIAPHSRKSARIIVFFMVDIRRSPRIDSYFRPPDFHNAARRRIRLQHHGRRYDGPRSTLIALLLNDDVAIANIAADRCPYCRPILRAMKNRRAEYSDEIG